MVEDCWKAERSPWEDDDMSCLVFKLKGLKVVVKHWGKKKKLVMKKDLYEIDS